MNLRTDTPGWDDGDIEVRFADGHTELLTQNQRCGRPQVSARGDVGWSVWKDFTSNGKHDAYFHSSETLRLKLHDGTIKDSEPNSLFIMKWGFADNNTTVVIQSMAHHGPDYLIKYDITTGKELGRIDHYVPHDQLPKWAQSFSDD